MATDTHNAAALSNKRIGAGNDVDLARHGFFEGGSRIFDFFPEEYLV
jgi:hypothetical protein